MPVSSNAADGLSRFGAQRALIREYNPTRRHHQGRQRAGPARADRRGLDIPHECTGQPQAERPSRAAACGNPGDHRSAPKPGWASSQWPLRWRKVDSKRRSRAMARSGPRRITRYPAGYAARGQVPRLTALSPAWRDDTIRRIHSAVTVTPPPTNFWALLAFRESCGAKSSCATYGQPGNCRTPDLPSAV
jgi:hypothetical protein